MHRSLPLWAIVVMLAIPGIAAGDPAWDDELKSKLIGKQVALKQPVYKIAFAFNRKDVMNVSVEGVYYKSGLFKAYTIDELAEKVDGRPDTIPPAQDARIHDVEFGDDHVKVKFETDTAKGAITFHVSKDLERYPSLTAFEQEFQPLYEQFFARSRADILAEHPEWTPDLLSTLKAGEIDIGMTKDMVLYALGEPLERITQRTAAGITEEWTYKMGVTGTMYVAFDDGTVSSISEAR